MSRDSLCGSPGRPTGTRVAGHMSMLTKFNPDLQATLSGARVSARSAGPANPALGTSTRQADGMTDVDVAIVREGKNLKGKVLAGVLGTVGKHSLGKAFAASVKAIEARNRASVVEI